METLISFAVQISAMTLLTCFAEQLLPQGALKRTAAIGVGLVFVAAIASELTGIFQRMGV